MRLVRFYIEGNKKKGPQELREGFRVFLRPLREIVLPHWDVRAIMCGSRWDAFEDFKTGSTMHPDDFCVLLVDSEWLVTKGSPWQHLGENESWDMQGFADDHCYLMAQAMEAWFFADIDAVAEFYGQHFNRNAMGNTQDIESIPKKDLIRRMAQATSHRELIRGKGKYHKGNHSGFILLKIDPLKVRDRLPHCQRIFVEIPKAIAGL